MKVWRLLLQRIEFRTGVPDIDPKAARGFRGVADRGFRAAGITEDVHQHFFEDELQLPQGGLGQSGRPGALVRELRESRERGYFSGKLEPDQTVVHRQMLCTAA